MVKILLIILVIAILMEDGSSIRKTEEERKEEEDLAKAVNATLAEEEEKKRLEEKKKEDESKGKKNSTDRKESEEKKKDVGSQGEDCLPCNITCPSVKPCIPCEECPPKKECGSCPDVDPCQPCGPCPPIKPCNPCPVDNTTRGRLECPELPACTETSGMSVPVAMVVGASISLVTMGAAAVVGLILRYVPPLISGLLFLSIVFVVWFLSSHYPDVARDMGGRVATLLREAAEALGHRVMEAIQRHQDQVGLFVLILFFLRMSSMFI
jgi:hypothetical protein